MNYDVKRALDHKAEKYQVEAINSKINNLETEVSMLREKLIEQSNYRNNNEDVIRRLIELFINRDAYTDEDIDTQLNSLLCQI